jgi:hypothetical protein
LLGRAVVAALSFGAGPTLAFAQTASDPIAEAALRWASFGLTPRVALRNVGVDTNVFNTAGEPLRDFVATVAPGADSWWRAGRTLVTMRTTVEWNYFQRATSQRSVNLGQEALVEWRTARVTPRVSGAWGRTRQRPTLEIDARVQQETASAEAGVVVRVGHNLTVDAFGKGRRLDFGGRHGDAVLAAELNRESREWGVHGRLTLSPITTVGIRGTVARDTFLLSSLRDSRSWSVVPGVEFRPIGLLSGAAAVGFRHFDAVDPGVPDVAGVIAAVNVAYTARDAYRVRVRLDRDVEYSFSVDEPYYVATAASVELTRVVALDWDVVGRAGRSLLAYQSRTGHAGGRDEVIRTIGGGLGRRLANGVRLGLDIDHVRRASVAGRSYSGMRAGGSVTYGY